MCIGGQGLTPGALWGMHMSLLDRRGGEETGRGLSQWTAQLSSLCTFCLSRNRVIKPEAQLLLTRTSPLPLPENPLDGGQRS